jgi:Arc/MetJ-type ribon-helix-helix transcriptional regulator
MMTKKSTVSFTDRHHAYAVDKVEEGVFASVSSVVAAGIERIMQDEQERSAALEAMKVELVRRLETPRDEWVEHGSSDDLFEKARARIRSRNT